MAINFGQQINQALSSTLDRNQRGRIRAQQLAQQLQEQQFNQRMKSMVQNLRERQFQMQQEAQEEELINNAFQQRLAEDREERLNRLTNAQIANMGNDGSSGGSGGGGNSDYLRVTEVQTNNSQIEQLNQQLQNLNEDIQKKRSVVDEAAAGDTMMNGTRVEGEDNVTMEEALSDPDVRRAGVESLALEAQRENILDQIQQLRQRNQSLFNRSENQQPQQQSGGPIKSSVFE